MLRLPHIIALCGYPGSGKTEVQTLLCELGVQAIDDGAPLREFSRSWLGLSHSDVYTQEGKLRSSKIAGKDWQNRQMLGELGKKLEEMFGPDIMPFMATRRLLDVACYSFGSVRRRQGWFYKDLGGVVIGIRRLGCGPTGNDFDEFDGDAVDYWIDNDGSIDDLRLKIEIVLQRLQFSNIIRLVA